MTDRIHVQPAHLRQAAAHHQQTADYLRTVPSSHDAIRESLDSLGPIFSELRDTGRELLELRKQCYQQQADNHADIAQNLRTSAAMWEQHERAASRSLGNIIDGADDRAMTDANPAFDTVHPSGHILVRSCRGGYMHSVSLSEAAMETDAETLAEAILLTADVSCLKALLEVRNEIVAAGHTPSAQVPTTDDLNVAIEKLLAHQLRRRNR